MRVTIGITVYDTFKAKTVVSLLKGFGDFPFEVHLSVQKGPYLDKGREAIVTDALSMGSEKILFIDTDLEFPPDAMRRILEHRKAIIGGAYNEKRLPPVSTVKLDDGKGGYVTGSGRMPDKPFMCAAVATGFLALHLPTITAKMQPPFFEYDHQEGWMAGEDIYFCQKARRAGLEIWCDPTIPLRHIGDYDY